MASRPPVDFDAVLRALGAEDAEPPPLMRKLLNELPGDPPSSAASMETAEAQLLAELETWLQVLVARREGRTPRT